VIKQIGTLESQIKLLQKELNKFADNLQDNINVSATREAANVIKREIKNTPMKEQGEDGTYKKNLRLSDIRNKKRRRTPKGWERFKLSIKATDKEKYWYNIITHSKEDYREIKASSFDRLKRQKNPVVKFGRRRGKLKRDPFMQRATKRSSNRAIRAYMMHMRERIRTNGDRVKRATMNNALKNSRIY
jgi:hypothetical protein